MRPFASCCVSQVLLDGEHGVNDAAKDVFFRDLRLNVLIVHEFAPRRWAVDTPEVNASGMPITFSELAEADADTLTEKLKGSQPISVAKVRGWTEAAREQSRA